MSSITLEDAVSMSEIEYINHFEGSMFNVWAALERWNNYQVEKRYRSIPTFQLADLYSINIAPGEDISSMSDGEVFMFLCFVLLSEDRWPFADEN